jgi:hypothetical protein
MGLRARLRSDSSSTPSAVPRCAQRRHPDERLAKRSGKWNSALCVQSRVLSIAVGTMALARDQGDAYPLRTALPTPNPRPGAHATGIDGGKGAPPREASVHRIVSRWSTGA